MQLGDRELSRGNVVQEPEEQVQRILSGVGMGAEQEDLGIELLERAFDVLRPLDADHALEPQRARRVPGVGVRRHDDRVGGDGLRVVRPSEEEQRELRGISDATRPPAHDEPVGALTFGRSRRVPVTDLHEDGDAVTFRDRLTQPAQLPTAQDRTEPTRTRESTSRFLACALSG